MNTRAVSGVDKGEHGPASSACTSASCRERSQHELPLPPSGARRDAHMMRVRGDRVHGVAGSGRPQEGRERVGCWRAVLSGLWRAARALGLGAEPRTTRPPVAAPATTPVSVPGLRIDARARTYLRAAPPTRRHRDHQCRAGRQTGWSRAPRNCDHARRASLDRSGMAASLHRQSRGPAGDGHGVGASSRPDAPEDRSAGQSLC